MSTTFDPVTVSDVPTLFGVDPVVARCDALHLSDVLGVEPTSRDMAAFYAGRSDALVDWTNARTTPEPGLMVAAAVNAGMPREASYWEGYSLRLADCRSVHRHN